MIGGEQVELVDVLALFAGGGRTLAAKPLCLLAPDPSGWLDAFLRPTLEAAGYRCATHAAPGEAAVTIALDDAPASPSVGGGVVRLAREVGGAGVYRYDRAGVLAALAARVGSR